jgi:Flp pilus assembly protein TadD
LDAETGENRPDTTMATRQEFGMAPKRGGYGKTGRAYALLAAPLAATLLIAGCNSADNRFKAEGVTTSMADGKADEKLQQATEHWAKRFAANPKDKTAALNLSQVLRAQGKKAQALVIMRQAALHHTDDAAIQGELGKALADAGRNGEAISVLEKLAGGGNADWRVISSYGTVLDQMERHAEARQQYQRALQMEPNQPSVLSNLGLSYALDRNLPEAEKTLRLAAAQPRRRMWCGRTWRWCWACRASSRKPNRWPARQCPSSRPATISAISGKC